MKNFIREWGIFIIIVLAAILSRVFIWENIIVDGHSMDPTLADRERLVIVKTASIDRFDIVVAQETDTATQQKKNIVKRVIGMPGDTIHFKNDQLIINGKDYKEPYLTEFQSQLKSGDLAKTYGEYPLTKSLKQPQRDYFVQLAGQTKAFTTDSTGNPDFTVKVPEGEYFLMGDDRVVSSDSRMVGSFKRSQITGEAKFRFWPFSNFGTVK